jgi:hypothetical protein
MSMVVSLVPSGAQPRYGSYVVCSLSACTWKWSYVTSSIVVEVLVLPQVTCRIHIEQVNMQSLYAMRHVSLATVSALDTLSPWS